MKPLNMFDYDYLIGKWVMSHDPGYKLIRYFSKEHGPHLVLDINNEGDIILDKPGNPFPPVLQDGFEMVRLLKPSETINRDLNKIIISYCLNSDGCLTTSVKRK